MRLVEQGVFYRLAIATGPTVLAMLMYFGTSPFLSTKFALPIILLNIAVYLLICFVVIHLVSTKAKTDGNLLFGGIGLILQGVFAAGFSNYTIMSLQELNASDHEHLAAFGTLLQNIYLYVSAAIGGGIAGASVFAPADNACTPAIRPKPPKPLKRSSLKLLRHKPSHKLKKKAIRKTACLAGAASAS